MKIVLYWLTRTGIFVALVFVLWLIGWFDLISILAAFVMGWLISYLALAGMRRQAQEQTERILARSKRKIQATHAEEDAELDSRLTVASPSDPDAERE